MAETNTMLSLFLANNGGSEISVEKLPLTCLFFSGREGKAIIRAMQWRKCCNIIIVTGRNNRRCLKCQQFYSNKNTEALIHSITVFVWNQLLQYITIDLRLTDTLISLTEMMRGSCLSKQRGPLRLYMNEVNGKCFVQCSLSDSSVVLGRRPWWRSSRYQRYFPFCWLCVITCHPPTAGSLWEGWLHLLVIGRQ